MFLLRLLSLAGRTAAEAAPEAETVIGGAATGARVAEGVEGVAGAAASDAGAAARGAETVAGAEGAGARAAGSADPELEALRLRQAARNLDAEKETLKAQEKIANAGFFGRSWRFITTPFRKHPYMATAAVAGTVVEGARNGGDIWQAWKFTGDVAGGAYHVAAGWVDDHILNDPEAAKKQRYEAWSHGLETALDTYGINALTDLCFGSKFLADIIMTFVKPIITAFVMPMLLKSPALAQKLGLPGSDNASEFVGYNPDAPTQSINAQGKPYSDAQVAALSAKIGTDNIKQLQAGLGFSAAEVTGALDMPTVKALQATLSDPKVPEFIRYTGAQDGKITPALLNSVITAGEFDPKKVPPATLAALKEFTQTNTPPAAGTVPGKVEIPPLVIGGAAPTSVVPVPPGTTGAEVPVLPPGAMPGSVSALAAPAPASITAATAAQITPAGPVATALAAAGSVISGLSPIGQARAETLPAGPETSVPPGSASPVKSEPKPQPEHVSVMGRVYDSVIRPVDDFTRTAVDSGLSLIGADHAINWLEAETDSLIYGVKTKDALKIEEARSAQARAADTHGIAAGTGKVVGVGAVALSMVTGVGEVASAAGAALEGGSLTLGLAGRGALGAVGAVSNADILIGTAAAKSATSIPPGAQAAARDAGSKANVTGAGASSTEARVQNTPPAEPSLYDLAIPMS